MKKTLLALFAVFNLFNFIIEAQAQVRPVQPGSGDIDRDRERERRARDRDWRGDWDGRDLRRDRLVNCALERGYCQVPDKGVLFYGNGRRWVSKDVTEAGSFYCGNETFRRPGFDGDPDVGASKACSYRVEMDRGNDLDLVKCADEGGFCDLSKIAGLGLARNEVLVLRYGVNGRSETVKYDDRSYFRLTAGGYRPAFVRCDHRALGIFDPASGFRKSCYVGLEVAGRWGRRDHRDNFPGPGRRDDSGRGEGVRPRY